MSLSDKILKNWEWKTDMIEAKHVREAIKELKIGLTREVGVFTPSDIKRYNKLLIEVFGEELTK